MSPGKKRFTPSNIAFIVAAVGLMVLAINQQLQRPPDQRTWQGSVFGVPYDFRMPTFERIKGTLWNKDSSQVLVPKAFGMGWDVNFYPLFHPQEA